MEKIIKSDSKMNKSNDLFFDMFENSAMGMIVVEVETDKFQFANKSFLNSFGYSRDEIIGKSSSAISLITAEFREKIQLQIGNKVTVNNIEIELKNKKNEQFWFLVSIQMIQFQGKKCSLYSFINISKSKKNEVELVIANKKLAFQYEEKEKRANELLLANKELKLQNKYKEKRAAELLIANKELIFQTGEKQNRADELIIANKELLFQTGEKQNRADELVIADIELAFQNDEKEKRVIENKELEDYNNSLKLASQYSLSLIEASLDPLFAISIDGTITDVNEATVKATDVSKTKLIGSEFFKYFTNKTKAKESYVEVFSKGFITHFPLTIKDHK